MKVPFPQELPQWARRVGRTIIPAALRADVAAHLQYLAHRAAHRDPAFQRSIENLTALRNRHRGETCVIIGNGPSVAKQDFSALSGLSTFCLNRGYLLWREQGLTPTYLVAVNDLVIEQFHDELAGVGCPLFVPWSHRDSFKSVNHVTFLEIRWHKKFFPDPRRGIWSGATVTFAAMQLAYYFGFTRVLLIGVDHVFKDQGPAHQEVLQAEDDANHFSPEYFGKGVRWNLPDLVQSEVAYRMARDAFNRDGRRIIDCTTGGALTVFVKMPLDEALSLWRAGTLA